MGTAATYHVQKWAHALKVQSQPHKPVRPSRCDDLESTFACMHSAMPRLMVGGGEVQKALNTLCLQHGADSEAKVRRLGVPVEDLRALSPHLERYIARLGRLSTTLRPRQLGEFIFDHFKPALGTEASRRITDFVVGVRGL